MCVRRWCAQSICVYGTSGVHLYTHKLLSVLFQFHGQLTAAACSSKLTMKLTMTLFVSFLSLLQ